MIGSRDCLFAGENRAKAMCRSLRGLATVCVVFVAVDAALAATAKRGQFSYAAERNCVDGGVLTAEQCANAAANARAEFDEKTPHFPTRDACERVFAGAGCSLGFAGSDGWAGKKSGIYFTPRQSGFRVSVASDRDMTVVPFTAGPPVTYAPRSVLTRDTQINPVTARHARDSWRARPTRSARGTGGQFGVDTPSGAGSREDLPPPPPVDPNFDCASVLEPSAKDTANTACYLAPRRR